MLQVVTNSSIRGVQSVLAQNARVSFEFLANSILSSSLSQELCRDVQDLLVEREDFTLDVAQPRALAVALHAYLQALGVFVLVNIEIPRSEILTWLNLSTSSGTTANCVLTVDAKRVSLQWIEI